MLKKLEGYKKVIFVTYILQLLVFYLSRDINHTIVPIEFFSMIIVTFEYAFFSKKYAGEYVNYVKDNYPIEWEKIVEHKVLGLFPAKYYTSFSGNSKFLTFKPDVLDKKGFILRKKFIKYIIFPYLNMICCFCFLFAIIIVKSWGIGGIFKVIIIWFALS